MLDARRGIVVSEPRDMLFVHRAILALAAGTENKRKLVEVDYGKSRADVYTDMARYFFEDLKHT